MFKKQEDFIKKRINSFSYAARGIWLLIKTEDNFKVQLTLAFLICILGSIVNISSTEWILQLLTIGLVLIAEALNTAIEKICDFIHPEQHNAIKTIKDIAAGAPGIAAIISIIIGLIIYIPKLLIILV